MSIYTVDLDKSREYKGLAPSFTQIRNAILVTNPDIEHFVIVKKYKDGLGINVLECENKPVDLPDYGVYWIEFED